MHFNWVQTAGIVPLRGGAVMLTRQLTAQSIKNSLLYWLHFNTCQTSKRLQLPRDHQCGICVGVRKPFLSSMLQLCLLCLLRKKQCRNSNKKGNGTHPCWIDLDDLKTFALELPTPRGQLWISSCGFVSWIWAADFSTYLALFTPGIKFVSSEPMTNGQPRHIAVYTW